MPRSQVSEFMTAVFPNKLYANPFIAQRDSATENPVARSTSNTTDQDVASGSDHVLNTTRVVLDAWKGAIDEASQKVNVAIREQTQAIREQNQAIREQNQAIRE